MAKGRSQRAAPVVTQSRASTLYSAASRLPSELIIEILDHLGQHDLWRAAAASRAFNAAAKRAGLYIYRTILWGGAELDDYDADLSAFREIVQRVLQHNLLLSFTLSASFDDESDLEKHSACDKTMQPVLMELLSTLTTSLRVLVSLSLYISDHFSPLIGNALLHPAPRLKELNLIRIDTGACTLKVPLDLFDGYAPKLRDVLLVDIPLGLDSIPAFALVASAEFNYTQGYLDFDFSYHFPRLRNIQLSFFTLDGAPPPHRFKLDGLSLKKLTICDGDDHPLIRSLERSITLGDIPILELVAIEQVTSAVHWKEPLWPRVNSDSLSIRLMKYQMSLSHMSIYVVPEHRKWRRTYHVRLLRLGSPSTLAGMPGVSDRLTYLRMENLYLVSFLECNGLTLDALRELQVDFESKQELQHATMLWPPDWASTLSDGQVSFDESHISSTTFSEESYQYIYCHNLQTLTLFAMDTAMSLDSQEAAFLGRALGQASRRHGERAALVLIGIEFKKPVAQTLLDQTYSSTRRYEFAGYDSVDGHDHGLWDEDI